MVGLDWWYGVGGKALFLVRLLKVLPEDVLSNSQN